jgi:lysine biosynthesis protein LysW
MNLTCPECKNEVDLSTNPNLAIGDMTECNHCGITLEVKSITEGVVEAEIADEGK